MFGMKQRNFEFFLTKKCVNKTWNLYLANISKNKYFVSALKFYLWKSTNKIKWKNFTKKKKKWLLINDDYRFNVNEFNRVRHFTIFPVFVIFFLSLIIVSKNTKTYFNDSQRFSNYFVHVPFMHITPQSRTTYN